MVKFMVWKITKTSNVHKIFALSYVKSAAVEVLYELYEEKQNAR